MKKSLEFCIQKCVRTLYTAYSKSAFFGVLAVSSTHGLLAVSSSLQLKCRHGFQPPSGNLILVMTSTGCALFGDITKEPPEIKLDVVLFLSYFKAFG